MAGTAAFLKGKKLPMWQTKKVSASPQKRGGLSRVTVEAGDSLLRAVKGKILHKHGKIDVALLRKQGYSEALIARLKAL